MWESSEHYTNTLLQSDHVAGLSNLDSQRRALPPPLRMPPCISSACHQTPTFDLARLSLGLNRKHQSVSAGKH